jgi:hypothetical protein
MPQMVEIILQKSLINRFSPFHRECFQLWKKSSLYYKTSKKILLCTYNHKTPPSLMQWTSLSLQNYALLPIFMCIIPVLLLSISHFLLSLSMLYHQVLFRQYFFSGGAYLKINCYSGFCHYSKHM